MKNQAVPQKFIDVEVKDTLSSRDRAIWILVFLMLILLIAY